jgi:hypothetical protein
MLGLKYVALCVGILNIFYSTTSYSRDNPCFATAFNSSIHKLERKKIPYDNLSDMKLIAELKTKFECDCVREDLLNTAELYIANNKNRTLETIRKDIDDKSLLNLLKKERLELQAARTRLINMIHIEKYEKLEDKYQLYQRKLKKMATDNKKGELDDDTFKLNELYVNEALRSTNNKMIDELEIVLSANGLPVKKVQGPGGDTRAVEIIDDTTVLTTPFSRSITKLKKRFQLSRLYIDPAGNIKANHGGAYYPNLRAISLGVDNLSSFIKNPWNNVLKHESRHLYWSSLNQKGKAHPFRASYISEGGNKLLTKETDSIYNRYLSTEEIYTYMTDLKKRTTAVINSTGHEKDLNVKRLAQNLVTSGKILNDIAINSTKAKKELGQAIKAIDDPKQYSRLELSQGEEFPVASFNIEGDIFLDFPLSTPELKSAYNKFIEYDEATLYLNTEASRKIGHKFYESIKGNISPELQKTVEQIKKGDLDLEDASVLEKFEIFQMYIPFRQKELDTQRRYILQTILENQIEINNIANDYLPHMRSAISDVIELVDKKIDTTEVIEKIRSTVRTFQNDVRNNMRE